MLNFTNLPEYARSDVAIELLRAIVATPPEAHLIRDDFGTRDHHSFAGPLAGRLRQMHKEWREREFTKLDRHFSITGFWDEARSKEICGTEDGNQLIERVLRDGRHPVKDYVNNHPYCLHLWRPLDAEIPLPPALLVGIPGVEIAA